MKSRKVKPNRVGANKHQASKKGYKHKHNLSRGQLQSQKFNSGKVSNPPVTARSE